MEPISRREFVAAAAVGGAALAAAPRAPLRLGLLGMWHSHANGLVRQAAEHPEEFSLVGFHDSDRAVAADRRKAWEPKLPNFRLFDSPEALLREPMDGVVVEGQVYENLKYARMALESGRPVMLEKPAGTDLEEHRRLIALAREKKLHVQMIYLFRYMSAVQEVLARAKKNEFGRIYEFRARLPKDLREYAYFVDQLKPYKGGMFFEMAGHVIDMMVALLGKPKSVQGFLGHHHSEPPASYVDHGVAVFGFDHAWGVIEVPAIETVPHSRRLEVYGTGGAAMIPHLGSGHLANKDLQPVDVCKAGGAWERLDLKAQTLHLRDLREFAAVVAGRKEPDFSMDHDLAVHEALLRASGMC
jgi:predicted dehydrogenase